MSFKKKRILVACESSGATSNLLEAMGHEVLSCDLLPSDCGRKNHYQGSVFDVLNDGWDMMIGHPPCTYMANSGNKHLLTDSDRYAKMTDGAMFFKALLNANIPQIALENPILNGKAIALIGRKYDQLIQPWMFGHPETKATCLWLKNLPKLKETNNVKEYMLTLPKKERQKMFYLPPSADRWKLRSKTYDGIAKAFAEQWSNI